MLQTLTGDLHFASGQEINANCNHKKLFSFSLTKWNQTVTHLTFTHKVRHWVRFRSPPILVAIMMSGFTEAVIPARFACTMSKRQLRVVSSHECQPAATGISYISCPLACHESHTTRLILSVLKAVVVRHFIAALKAVLIPTNDDRIHSSAPWSKDQWIW